MSAPARPRHTSTASRSLWHRGGVPHLAPVDVADPTSLLRAVEHGLPGVVTPEASGDSFLFYDPDGITVLGARFPFCTIVTGDRYDAASGMDRNPATCRVNVGVDRRSYDELFGLAPRQAAGDGVIDTGFGYTLTDTPLPHPDRAHAVARPKYDSQKHPARGGSSV